MIDLTPLDIRKKRGDFHKAVRGYDREEVDHFLELAAERLEQVVKENLALKERARRLEERVQEQEGREKAVQEALVTAQNLRDDIKQQARREAEVAKREAETEATSIRAEVDRLLEERRRELDELGRMRSRFLKGFRTFLEREIDAVEAEEANAPPLDFERSGSSGSADREPLKPLDSLLADEGEAAGDEPGGDAKEARHELDETALETTAPGKPAVARDDAGENPSPKEAGDHERRDG